MDDILIVADDLSGAADCAIPFARTGRRTVVALTPGTCVAGAAAEALTLAVDADTRRRPAEEAAARTRAIYLAQRRAGQRLYQKIDSTLRGNWAVETAALRPLAGMALVAPAHPALGRTVRGGQVHVGGEALADTALWQLEHAHRPAGIAQQLQAAGLATESLDADAMRDDVPALAARIEALAASGAGALIVDAGSEATLRALARASADSAARFFWVGSGGLAREIAALQAGAAAPAGADLLPPRGPTLVVAGSLSAVTDRQCAVLRQATGMRELVVPPAVLRQGPPHAQWSSVPSQIGELLGGGADVLLRIGRDPAVDPAEGALLAAALARLVAPHIARAGAVIATVGETARALLVAAGIACIELLAELQTGVAAGLPRPGGRHGPYIVTKAGGFGHDGTLLEAWSRLRPAPASTPE